MPIFMWIRQFVKMDQAFSSDVDGIAERVLFRKDIINRWEVSEKETSSGITNKLFGERKAKIE